MSHTGCRQQVASDSLSASQLSADKEPQQVARFSARNNKPAELTVNRAFSGKRLESVLVVVCLLCCIVALLVVVRQVVQVAMVVMVVVVVVVVVVISVAVGRIVYERALLASRQHDKRRRAGRLVAGSLLAAQRLVVCVAGVLDQFDIITVIIISVVLALAQLNQVCFRVVRVVVYAAAAAATTCGCVNR